MYEIIVIIFLAMTLIMTLVKLHIYIIDVFSRKRK